MEITCLCTVGDRLFVSGGNDKKIVFWDGENFDLVKVVNFEGPEEFIKAMIVFKGTKYKDHLIVFTEAKNFYVIKLDI